VIETMLSAESRDQGSGIRKSIQITMTFLIPDP